MKITQSILVPALANCARVSSPVAGVTLAASGGSLRLIATDFTMSLSLALPCEGDLAPVAVNAPQAAEIVAAMRAEAVSLNIDGARLTIAGERGAKRSLPTLRDTLVAVPPLKDEVSFGVEAAAFHEGIAFVRPFLSTDPAKMELHGVHIHSVAGAVRAVGAFRGGMAFAEVGSCLNDVSVSIPPQLLDLIERAAPKTGPAFFSSDGRQAEFSWAQGSVRGPVIAAGFPDYTRVIPHGDAGILSVNADELVAATRSAQTAGYEERSSRSRIVKLSLNGSVELSASSEKGEAVEPVDAEWDGEAMCLGLMSTQIINGLSRLKSAPLRVEIRPSPAPLIFRSERHSDRLAALMPVAL